MSHVVGSSVRRGRAPLTGALRWGIAGMVLAAAAVVVPSPSAGAADPCARWAATDGDDGSAGTEAAPYRSLGKLVGSLAPGETGCLPAGETYYAVAGNGIIGGGGSPAAPVTVTSGPGGRAAVKGQLWVQGSAHDLVLTDLAFAGNYRPDGTPNGTKATHLIIHGDRISVVGNDISDGRGICVGVGKGHGSSDAPEDNVEAEDVRITHNVIHGCGMDPTITWHTTDSGAHGVYLEHSRNAVVRHNLIHSNRYRGLQLWPRNEGAEIAYNTFDDNATHVNIGSSSACGGTCRAGVGFESVNTDVHHNIMSNRVTDWRPAQNPSQVYGFFSADTQPDEYGNAVHHNCLAPGDPGTTGHGYVAHDNVTAAVSYVDRAGGDYTLTAGSSCAGWGPSWLQPGGSGEPPPVEPPSAPAHRPDAQARKPGQALWTGAGVYGGTQQLTVRVRRGESRTVHVRVRNEGSASDDWSFAEAGPGGAKVTRRWLLAGDDVTADIDGGTLGFQDVAPGASRKVLLRVRAKRGAEPGTIATWALHGVHNPVSDGIRDVITIRVRVVR